MYSIEDNFTNVIEYFCKLNGLNVESLIEFLKKKENKYLLLLIIKKYGDINDKRIKEVLRINGRGINSTLRRAEEKVLISKSFRDKYFKLEDVIKKII